MSGNGTSTGSAKKWAVVVFPGSNCDVDAVRAVRDVFGFPLEIVWHTEALPRDVDCAFIPGGFSYGDYLRSGALAARSRVMQSVREHAARGGLVIGVCNGFQILQEAGLLPGALLKNRGLRFRCMDVHLRTERGDLPFTEGHLAPGDVIRLPIAHGWGNFFAPPAMLAEIEANGQVLFRYCAPDGAVSEGAVTDAANPNGSLNNIAGIVNRDGNVLGMMPHPERACESLLGGADGRAIFEAMQAAEATEKNLTG